VLTARSTTYLTPTISLTMEITFEDNQHGYL
jgi:hypothetical protein